MKLLKKKKPVELPRCNLERNYESLPESTKLIYRAIVDAYKNGNPKVHLPKALNIYLITEEKLMEFKNDFDALGDKDVRHNRYCAWMESIGLKYEKHRAIIKTIIWGIYDYTNGELDYRNNRMLKKVRYTQKRTRLKREELEKCRLLRGKEDEVDGTTISK